MRIFWISAGNRLDPEAESVSEEEELQRVVPVIEALAKRTDRPISIDTYKASVAKAALDAGAAMVNDISAGRLEPGLPVVAAQAGVPLILMHMKGRPRDMQQNPHYDHVVEEVRDFLLEAAKKAESVGRGSRPDYSGPRDRFR